MDFITDIHLPKWPAMVVVGKPVTEDQAKEILIRTCLGFYFSTNDREFEKELEAALGIPEEVDYRSIEDENERFKAIDDRQKIRNSACEKYHLIDVDYLTNSQVVSCWIGGTHGWCNWNGVIGCSNYNIGKWPDAEEVRDEWGLIAKAFPFLELQCQLFCGEACEEDIVPVVQYNIKDGKVEMVKCPEGTQPLERIRDHSIDLFVYGMNNGLRGERGCTIEQFKNALEVTEAQWKKHSHMVAVE